LSLVTSFMDVALRPREDLSSPWTPVRI
jgi:hypothetical protein